METPVSNVNILLEATTRPEKVSKFHYKPRSSKVQSVLKSGYPDITIPSDANIDTYLQSMFQTGSRGGINPKNLPGVQDWFPLFDLLSVLDTKVASLSSAAEQDIQANTDEDFNKWEANVKGATSSIPIEYRPISTQARILQNKILQGASLGETRLEQMPNKDISFHAAVEFLLETLTDMESPVLAGDSRIFPKKIADFFDNSGKEIVHKILHDVNGIISGSFAIDKKIDEIFGYSASTRLTNISLAFYKLFTRELNTAVNIFLTPVSKTNVITLTTGTTAVAYDECVSIKDKLLADIVKDPNLYDMFIGDSDTKTTCDYEPFLDLYFRKYGHDVKTYYITPVPALSGDFKFKIDLKDPLNLNYDYSIKNLIAAAKSDYTEATNVYNLLTDLGNHIKTKSPKDILGGANQIAQGLSFGVKNMGE
jgi:hypothetical protein